MQFFVFTLVLINLSLVSCVIEVDENEILARRKPSPDYIGFVSLEDTRVTLSPVLTTRDFVVPSGSICGFRLYSYSHIGEILPFDLEIQKDESIHFQVVSFSSLQELRRRKFWLQIAAYGCADDTEESARVDVVLKVKGAFTRSGATHSPSTARITQNTVTDQPEPSATTYVANQTEHSVLDYSSITSPSVIVAATLGAVVACCVLVQLVGLIIRRLKLSQKVEKQEEMEWDDSTFNMTANPLDNEPEIATFSASSPFNTSSPKGRLEILCTRPEETDPELVSKYSRLTDSEKINVSYRIEFTSIND